MFFVPSYVFNQQVQIILHIQMLCVRIFLTGSYLPFFHKFAFIILRELNKSIVVFINCIMNFDHLLSLLVAWLAEFCNTEFFYHVTCVLKLDWISWWWRNRLAYCWKSIFYLPGSLCCCLLLLIHCLAFSGNTETRKPS